MAQKLIRRAAAMPYRDRYQTRQQIVDDIDADRGDGVDED